MISDLGRRVPPTLFNSLINKNTHFLHTRQHLWYVWTHFLRWTMVKQEKALVVEVQEVPDGGLNVQLRFSPARSARLKDDLGVHWQSKLTRALRISALRGGDGSK